MDEAMISLWNQRVNHDDNVYILGDFCYRNEKSAEWYLSQLKGHKHLVLGNHDTRLLDNEIAMGYCDSIDRMMMYVWDSRKEICLCHLSDVGMEWLLQRSLALLWSYSR